MSNFDETLQTDQIEGAEFKFLGLEDRFERNKRKNFGFRNQNSRAEIENPERLSLITSSKKYAPRVLENFTVDYPATRKMSRSKIDIN